MFFAKDFLKDHKDIQLEDYQLPKQKLKLLGIEASKARERFKEASDIAKESDGEKKSTKQKKI